MSFHPLYHFTPPSNWMNDPNGLVYFRGEYHLFYQYHPDSDVWGPMHWGHAVSRDLVSWQHLPIALYPDEHGMIFSGSAVVDRNDTAGFGKDALVAIFTHHQDNVQSQSLAYSTDAGRTWTKYSANPVLTSTGSVDFRDPKVFWYGEADSGHWVMCLAVRDQIQFFTSPDLIHWTHSGNLGPGYGSTSGVWETPDLFELRVDNSDDTRWVLTVGVQDGAPARGSGTQYFVGRFDGKAFTSEYSPETVLWADYGADFYAAQSWNDEPNGRRLLIAWMNNWQYALVSPSADGQRGAFTLVREISLTQTTDGIRLMCRPIPELEILRGKKYHWQNTTIPPGTNLLEDIRGTSLEIVAEFKITADVDCFGFHVLMSEDQRTTISYNVNDQKLSVDRTHSGMVDFKESFAAKHSAEVVLTDETIRLHIFVDRSSVEVFANEGQVTITEIVFPLEDRPGMEVFAEGGEVQLISLDIFELESISFDVREG